MQNEIREDMLKVKRMMSDVEMIISKRDGETELVNKLIDAENLLTYCMSRLENAIVPPCKVDDKVYYISLGRIKTAKVIEIYYNGDFFAYRVHGDYTDFDIQEGDVYFTPEQAEQKLKEMRKDG